MQARKLSFVQLLRFIVPQCAGAHTGDLSDRQIGRLGRHLISVSPAADRSNKRYHTQRFEHYEAIL